MGDLDPYLWVLMGLVLKCYSLIILHICLLPFELPTTVANYKMGHLKKNDALLEQEEHFGWFKMLGMGTISQECVIEKKSEF